MFDKKVRIYKATAMTGLIKEDVVARAKQETDFLAKAGFEVFDPVLAEGVKPTKERLLSSKKQMDIFWPRDKAGVRWAHVVYDMAPHLNSEGVKHEIGYGRYHLQKPVVRIFPKGQLPVKSSVAYFEDDYVCDSLEEAIEYTLRVHGTYLKRLQWRISRTKRCLVKSIYFQVLEWLR